MTSQHAEHRRPTVLVVEDEALVRDLVEELLIDAGYRVVAAADAAAAEAAAEREPVLDALVVDLVLPGGGGADLATRVRSTHPEAGVVLVSGYAPEEGELPADVRFLQKPFSAVQLREALAAALEGRET